LDERIIPIGINFSDGKFAFFNVSQYNWVCLFFYLRKMNDQEKKIISHLKDEPIVWPLPSSTTPQDLTDILENTEKIVEVKNIDNLGFLNVITEDPNYQKTLEPYSKREKKVVEYVIWEAVDNVVKHSFKDPTTTDPNSTLSVTKTDHESYDEVQIITENFFEKKEVNETWWGINNFIKRIEDINKKSPEELDDEYKKELENTDLNSHGGGNLWFIAIARKIKKMYEKAVDNIFKAVITPIDEHISKLTMIIKIPIPKPVLE